MSQDLTRLTAAQLADGMRAGEYTSTDVTRAHLDRIEATDDVIGSFISVTPDAALATAADVDRRRAAGEDLHPFAGVPVSLKDVVVTAGIRTTAGSKMLEDWVPPYDSTVYAKIKDAGLPVLGKTNMDEFAMGSTTEHSAFGPTRNPWDTTTVPGGSSGGAATSAAAYQAPLAVGTDTGGSVRQPAAFTGTVGVKPTYGSVSRYGIVAMASSLDQVGPLGRTVADAAALHQLIAGHDPRDSTSLSDAVPDFLAAVQAGARDGSLKGKRLGTIRQLSADDYDDGVRAAFTQALELAQQAGAEIVEVDMPSLRYALDAYYLIMPSEASSNLARYDGMRFGLRVEPESGPVTAETVMSRDPRGRIRRRGQAPHPAGHLRPVGRLLRRLLRLRAEGAHPGAARPGRGLREGGRARVADRAHDGAAVRDGERRRPDGPLPGRCGDDPGEPGRHPRHEPAGGPGERHARGLPAAGTGSRGRAPLRGGLRDRGPGHRRRRRTCVGRSADGLCGRIPTTSA